MNYRDVKVKLILAAPSFFIFFANVALSNQSVLGAMQSFQDFCLKSDLSAEAVADLAQYRHYDLVVDRRFPGPGGSTIVNKTWHVKDTTGDFALTVTQNEGATFGRSFQCGVTLPKNTEMGVEAALEDASHFGAPDHIDVSKDGSKIIRWLKSYEWGTAEVGLTNRLPSLQGDSMINVIYRSK